MCFWSQCTVKATCREIIKYLLTNAVDVYFPLVYDKGTLVKFSLLISLKTKAISVIDLKQKIPSTVSNLSN